MEQARHAASTKRHAWHELQNRRKRKPVFLRMMGVLLVAGAALACFGLWRFQTPGIVLGPFEDEPSTAESVPLPEPEPQEGDEEEEGDEETPDKQEAEGTPGHRGRRRRRRKPLSGVDKPCR